MVAYSFQSRFVGRLVAGLEPGRWLPGMKRHTLRRPRAGRQGHARPEQPVHLYTAMRTRQCRQVGLGTACVQIPVTLYWNGERLLLGRREGRAPRSYTAQQAPIVQSLLESSVGELLHGESMDEFARADGFEDAADMARFFEPPERAGMMDLVLVGWRPGYEKGAFGYP